MTQQIAKPKEQKEIFLKFAPQIEKINPSLKANVFMEQVYHEWVNNEQLQQCPIYSILIAAKTAAQLGLLVGKVYGQAWIIAYWNNKTNQMEAQYQNGYKGLIILAKRSGYTIYPPQCICKGDKYKIDMANNKITHELDLEQERGEPLLWYVKCKEDATGNIIFERMTISEINKRRDSSLNKIKEDYKKKYSPWVTWYEEMCSKTVIKKLCNTLPCNDELREAMTHDDGPEEIDITPQPLTISTKEKEILQIIDEPGDIEPEFDEVKEDVITEQELHESYSSPIEIVPVGIKEAALSPAEKAQQMADKALNKQGKDDDR